jgi:uncharacterized protein YfaS (alpha-2-macroglobulin family)
MKDTEQSNPEIEMKAMQYVNVGYQRILTFECASGGFNWWEGDNPGNSILSALAIMMLKDTSDVYAAVDKRVIERSFHYLEGIQQGNGSWGENQHLHAGNENLGAGGLRSTCYIAWALNYGGFSKSKAAARAMQFIDKEAAGADDLYTVAMCANALASGEKKGATLDALLRKLDKAAVEEGDKIHWQQKGQTMVNSGGIAADVEVTALIALALIESGAGTAKIPAVVNWLVSTKDPQGNWGYNTQATVLALKTFLAAAKLDPGDTAAEVTVSLNGKKLGSRKFDNFNKDVLWQVEIPAAALDNANKLVFDYSGKGNLGYQVVATHNVPYSGKEGPKEALTIDVSYDRTKLKVAETVTVHASITRNDPDALGMVLVTLGIPPGFDVQTDDLDAMKREKVIRNFELTGRQLLIYLDELPLDKTVVLHYGLKSRYPVKAATGESEARLYYQGEVKSSQAPRMIEVE